MFKTKTKLFDYPSKILTQEATEHTAYVPTGTFLKYRILKSFLIGEIFIEK